MDKRRRNYIENPKTKGSGIICCIPQDGICPIRCPDCFFQGGRSYLEPLSDNLPNMPSVKQAQGRIVRVNDGNDSNNKRDLAVLMTDCYAERFFNTSIPNDLSEFPAPVVLIVNPGKITDESFNQVNPIPPNLMFVRVRANAWNLETVVDRAVDYYSQNEVPIVLTFMAYYTDKIRPGYEVHYSYRQRTMNSYWVITPDAWNKVMSRYAGNKWVYACGKDADTFACHRCGNCLREYFATKEKMRSLKG